jgi:hypothetical protein
MNLTNSVALVTGANRGLGAGSVYLSDPLQKFGPIGNVLRRDVVYVCDSGEERGSSGHRAGERFRRHARRMR